MGCFKVSILLTLLFFKKGFSKFTFEDLQEGCGKTMSDIELSSNTSDTTHVANFPWIARLGMYWENTVIFYCSGSLIHPKFVLTAAHCGKLADIVRLGESNLSHEKDCFRGVCAPAYQEIPIAQYLFADHCRLNNTNDLSLLVLDSPANISDFVRPICIPLEHYDLTEKRTFTAGWGVTYSGFGVVDGNLYKAERDLEYLEVPVLEREKCKGEFTRELEENELCVGYPQGGESPCVADSGGALIVSLTTDKEYKKKYIVGVASHNLQMCQHGEYSPVIYTNVSAHIVWIFLEMIKTLDPEFRKKSQDAK